jgi:hypothetical protein
MLMPHEGRFTTLTGLWRPAASGQCEACRRDLLQPPPRHTKHAGARRAKGRISSGPSPVAAPVMKTQGVLSEGPEGNGQSSTITAYVFADYLSLTLSLIVNNSGQAMFSGLRLV